MAKQLCEDESGTSQWPAEGAPTDELVAENTIVNKYSTARLEINKHVFEKQNRLI